MGPPAGFADALNRKYDIQQQEANSRGNLLTAQANAIPSTTASENALRNAQAFQTRQTGEQVAPLAQSQIGEAGARSGLYGAQGGYYGAESALASQTRDFNATPIGAAGSHALFSAHPALNGQQDQTDDAMGTTTNNGQYTLPGEKKGTANVRPGMKGSPTKAPAPTAQAGGGFQALMAALGGGGGGGAPMPQMPGAGPMMGAPAPAGPLGMFGGGTVPGQGSGKVDKVSAMLAPHEAVLNVAAADSIGRKKIAQANAKGAQKMGTAPAPGRGMPLAKKKA